MIAARERLSFAAGDLGFNFVWQSIELYLLYFYVRVIGLSPEAASAIFLAGALIDWLIDPLIGVLIDRAASRVSMRGWVLAGGSAAGVALIVAFAQPPLPGGWMVGYALVAHLVLRATYSLGNVPYGALTTRISSDPDDQVVLTAVRLQGAAIGGLIAAIVYAMLPARGPHASADFVTGAILLGVLAQPAFLATYFGVHERIVVPPCRNGPSGRDIAALFGLLRQSPELRRLLITILVAGMSVTVLNKSILFLFDRLDAVRLSYIAAGIPPLSLLLTAPVWLRLARRLGCVATLTAAAGLYLATALLLPFAGSSQAGLVAALTIALTAGSGMSVMFWALLPRVVDRVEVQHGGEACAARVYALGGIARKLAQALAPQFVALGLVLSDGCSVVPGIIVVGLLTLGTIVVYRPRDLVPAPSRLRQHQERRTANARRGADQAR